MDWNFQVSVFVFCVSQSVVAFNIEPNPWRYYTQNQDTVFGYKVVQKDQSSVIVSDPLVQYKNKRGEIYNCMVNGQNCLPLTFNEPSEAVNMSLGLSMTKAPQSSKILVCGPTIPKACEVATTYNGMCFIIEERYRVTGPIPRSLRECPPPSSTDIAFLLDGSGSVNPTDFYTMKEFVKKLIGGLRTQNIKFAVAEFSDKCNIAINFNGFDFKSINNKIDNIWQQGRWTNTAAAIKKLVDELFVSSAGAREDSTKVLIVITDGQSSDLYNLQGAVQNAERKKITRYAIGVGNAFTIDKAQEELRLIASQPHHEHVFRVDNFDLLDKIRQILENQITIAIEGTQTSGDSSRMEFAQDGFGIGFNPNGNIIMSAVGAFQWKGGYQEYDSRGQPAPFHTGSEYDSYLGYSLTVATIPPDRDPSIILGAPRHAHKGRVTILSSKSSLVNQHLESPKPQIGAYYGAEVCVVDLDADSYMNLLLVSAPMYIENNWEGRVFVYSQKLILSQTLTGIIGQRGRFGSALASPGDLNGDRIGDVVVGAPLEDDGQGSIYVFSGRTEDINPAYSQRIEGSSVRTGLRFFGLSLSEFAVDHSGDDLLDIAVGTKGAVVLLRSRPIVSLETKVTYTPSKISTKDTNCDNPLKNSLRLCFTMKGGNTYTKDLSANINYTLRLDAKRQNYRAFFSAKNNILSDSMIVTLKEECKEHTFFIEACTEDALNPLSNELKFTFKGLPIATMDNLLPVLNPAIKNTSDHNLDFEINCGEDKICTDNLKLDFNFSGSSDIKVGIMQDMDVTVFVVNRGENSYNSLITIRYPFGLSFRRFTGIQGRMECLSQDSDDRASLGTTVCQISKPIFRENAVASFNVTYNINKGVNFDRTVTFTATASSGNDKHSAQSELFKNKTINVKYAIYVALIRYENSSIHINFTAGKNNLEKPVSQILKVQNDLWDVTLTIVIKVPIKLGDKDIWTTKNLQIQDCSVDRDEPPQIDDFVAVLKKQNKVNCSVAVCRLFRCNANLKKRDSKFYSIYGNVSSGWIEQTGLRSAVFELISTATLEYNENKYIHFSTDSLHTAPTGTLNTQVEVYEEKNILKEIIGGAVVGLVILALITAGLYKAGFFKSHYKQMLEDADTGADGSS